MKKQPDTNESVRSKAVAQRARLEAKIEELKAEIGKHEFALQQIDQLIGITERPESLLSQSVPPSRKAPQNSTLTPIRTPVRPPVRPPLQSGSQPAAKKRRATKKGVSKKPRSGSDSGE